MIQAAWNILQGDCREQMRTLPAAHFHTVCTSPPYWGLRDYGIPGVLWPDGSICCYGLEPAIDLYVAHTVEICREIGRVLRDDGTLWWNIGDSYNAYNAGQTALPGTPSGETQHARPVLPSGHGLGEKSLKAGDQCLIPHRVALALVADGWYLRSTIIWAKRSPMPESVSGWRWTRCRVKISAQVKGKQNGAIYQARSRDMSNGQYLGSAVYEPCPGCPKCAANDGYVLKRGRWRPTTAHEYIFLFSKSDRYFCDGEAVKELCSQATNSKGSSQRQKAGAEGIEHNGGFNAAISGEVETRNPRSVWTFSNEPFKGAHFACVDDQTEALTKRGWKRHADLIDGELIAAYSQTYDSIHWEPAKFHRYDFDGEMVSIEKRDSSQLLTPNHRCLVRKRLKRGYGIRVVKAADLTSRMDMPMLAHWSGEVRRAVGRDMAELIGWYVTEGEKKRGNIVRINQSESANPEKVIRIRGLLVALKAEFKEYHRTRQYNGRASNEVIFAIRGELAKRLSELCPDKRLPPWVDELPENEAHAMLAGLVDGDGHRRKDGRSCIVQKDRESIERMQVLAIRCGYRAMVRPRKQGDYCCYLTTGRWLTLRKTSGEGVSYGRKQYTGVVWCPAVGSGFWLARRNGMPFITGNTFPTALPRKCIEAATSAAGCCPACGSQYAPVVESERVPTRPGTDTKIVRDNYQHRPDIDPQTNWDSSTLNYGNRDDKRHIAVSKVLGYRPTCTCNAGDPVPARVLEPFCGSGTTLQVATQLGREAIGIEQNPEYIEIAKARIVTPLRKPKNGKRVVKQDRQGSLFAEDVA